MAGPPPPWQFALIAYIPLLTGNLSAIGSGLIIYNITCTCGGKKLKESHHRLLLALSIYDFIYSIQKAYTFLLVPKGMQVPGAQGNLTTCTIQGMLIQLVHATPLYNAALSMYYWLSICRGMKAETFATYIEPYVHGSIFVLMSSLAITGAVIGLYNPAFSFCFIGSWPPGCETGPGSPQCERWPPQMMGLMYEIFANIWVQLCFLVVLFTNIDIWWKVRQQEQTIRKYMKEFEKKQQNNNSNNNNNRYSKNNYSNNLSSTAPEAHSNSETNIQRRQNKFNRERSVAIQSTLYVSAFALCWIGPLCFHLIDWIAGYKAFWCVLVLVIFTPTQGIWNAFTYARPTYNRIMRKDSNISPYQAFQLIFFYPEDLSTFFNSRSCGGIISSTGRSFQQQRFIKQIVSSFAGGGTTSNGISYNSSIAVCSEVPTNNTKQQQQQQLSYDYYESACDDYNERKEVTDTYDDENYSYCTRASF